MTTSGEAGHCCVDVELLLHDRSLAMRKQGNSTPPCDRTSRRHVFFPPKMPEAAMDPSHPIDFRVPSGLPTSRGKLPSSPPIQEKMHENFESLSTSPSPAAIVPPLKRSESRLEKDHVKLDLPDLRPKPFQTRPRDDDRLSSTSSVNSHAKVTIQQIITIPTLENELLKIKTNSRLMESSSPLPTKSPANSGGGSAKKSTLHSARQSARRNGEEADEEDPFRDDDLEDKFKRGNLKPITMAQWVVFFVMMGCLMSSLTVKQLKHKRLLGKELWKWVLLVSVVLCGRLLSGWFMKILIIFVEKNFLLRKKVLYFVYGLRKGVQNAFWLGLALLAWKLTLDPRVERSSKNHTLLVLVTKLLECFVIGAFIWLAKLLLMKSIASSFHVSTFFDRIQESLYKQHVLEILSNPPLSDFSFDAAHGRHVTVSLEERPGNKNSHADPAISIQDLQKISHKNVSAGLMKRLMNVVRHPGLGTLITTIDESVESDNIGINSELEAKAAGKMIFKNVAQPDARSIDSEDLLRFMPADEIPRVMCWFEGAKDTGKITKKALKNWVVNICQERRALASSLNDTKTAVKDLHRMVTAVVIIIIIVVSLFVLGIATTHALLFITSQLLLVGFIFSNTVKQTFEAVIFLFVMHPFDVGDRCVVEGQQLIVEEMKILTTVFVKPDNEKVFYPNSVLATKAISNLFRSSNMKEFLSFSVDISTSSQKINEFKDELALYLEKKIEHWAPKFTVIVKELDDLNSMDLSVTLEHTINFQDMGERLSRRSELLLEIKSIFASLGIEYRLLPQLVELDYPSTRQISIPVSSSLHLYPQNPQRHTPLP
ncbi:hypothetical protein KP509_38G068100 [Ceratopteris richardii]|uniref:Mechanosensitive ion channel protein n=1 Tax=Ceratopteris richardii TaxID=49495 RepID=A0A8T2Q5Q1_CERRI|nr:hypothetical protein KP509_38G068100 [Ceratopteris richardii]